MSVVRKFTFVFILFVVEIESLQKVNNKCDIPASAPKRIEEVIHTCQDEIKIAILSEALEVFNLNEHKTNREKRSAFNDDERKIAGCLLQCVYRKMKAVNEYGFPTVNGLVSLYTEGVSQKEYILATLQAVTKCLSNAQKNHNITSQILQDGLYCIAICNIANILIHELLGDDNDEVILAKNENYAEITIYNFEASKSCDVAYDVFDCVSEEVAKYCGQTP